MPTEKRSTYHLDLDALTVIRTDEHGEEHDLNAGGEPCTTREELIQFLYALYAEGAFNTATLDGLLSAARAAEVTP